jgi:hypothetical protein
MRFQQKILTLTLIVPFMFGCGILFSSGPRSFVQAIEPTWVSVEIRDDLSYDEAWREVVDILAKKFELEVISKDGGYIRTAWIYTWWKSGKITENYRVRAIVKFSADRKKVDIKTEANYLKDDTWVTGTDTRLLQTVKTDIMGVVGRTTR